MLPNRDHLEAVWCKAGVGEWNLGFELQPHHLVARKPCLYPFSCFLSRHNESS